MLLLNWLLWMFAAYLVGSLSPSYLAVRSVKGIDLRHYGTGTLGGSNAAEQLGRPWLLVFVALDLLKGLVPGLLLRLWGFDVSIVVLVSVAIVVGHNWSLYLGFAGGRGLATTAGVLLVWDVRLLLLLLLFLVLSEAAGHSGIGPMLGSLLLAPGAWLLGDAPQVVAGCALLVLVLAGKRLEANRLPLPKDPGARRAVLWRRFWLDRDVPRGQPWEERKRFN